MRCAPVIYLMGVFLFAGKAQATSMVAINLAQTVEWSRQGFVCQVRDVTTTHTSRGWGELVRCDVLENVFGTSVGQTISWIQVRGGEKDPIPGMPQFKPGETHLIFLTGAAPGSKFQAPLGLGQGDFIVVPDPRSKRSLAVNGYGNSFLFRGLDTQKIAAAVSAREKAANNSTAEPLQFNAAERRGNDLKSLVRIARALRAEVEAGAKPSEKFAGGDSASFTAHVKRPPQK